MAAEETQPLLPHHAPAPHLGKLAVMSLIVNKMVGTGIFSTPSLIFSLSGSIGVSLSLWLLGGVVCFCGLSIYIEFGLELPFSGGEKNYLQRVWRKPRGLVECVYAFQIVLLGFSSGNSYAFGRYVLFALGFGENDWTARFVGVGVITFIVYLHICHPYHGTRFFTILGVIKILILLLIIVLGLLVAIGVVNVSDGTSTGNFNDIWENYEGYEGNSYNVAVALLQIIYSFKGWENANYVLGEVKNPHHTLQVAAPLSVALTTIFYFLVIISYYIVIPHSELKESGVLIAGIFFKKIFGDTFSSRVLPLLISISNFGNVLAVSFSHSRINQEIAREGLIPYSNVFSNLRNSILLHWVVTVIVLLVPNGDVYQFVVNLYAYPGTWINVFVSLGLLYLHANREKEKWGLKPVEERWNAHWVVCLVFLVSNLFLALFPFVPPPSGVDTGNLPYFVFPMTGCSVLLAGVVYWYFRRRSFV